MHRVQVMRRKTHCLSAEVAEKRLDSMVKSISSPNNIKASSYEINSIASINLTCDGLRSFDHDESNHLSKVKIT